MTMTTIKVSKSLRDRLHRLAAEDGLTLAQEIDRLISDRLPQPAPTIGGFHSGASLSAEEIDAELMRDCREIVPTADGYSGEAVREASSATGFGMAPPNRRSRSA